MLNETTRMVVGHCGLQDTFTAGDVTMQRHHVQLNEADQVGDRLMEGCSIGLTVTLPKGTPAPGTGTLFDLTIVEVQ